MLPKSVTTYFKNIKDTVVTVLDGMAVTQSWIWRRPITTQYPFAPTAPEIPLGNPESLPERYRGFLEVDVDICTACLACERACPIECIRIDVEKKEERRIVRFDIDMLKCMFCGLCSEPCPTGAIRHTAHFESPVAHPEHLLIRFVDPARPVLPYKIKKGEEPKTKPMGEIARAKYVTRRWDAPPIRFPEIPKVSAPTTAK